MVTFLAKSRKAVLAAVGIGASAYAALGSIAGINPYVQLGAAIVAGLIGGAVVWLAPNAPDTPPLGP